MYMLCWDTCIILGCFHTCSSVCIETATSPPSMSNKVQAGRKRTTKQSSFSICAITSGYWVVTMFHSLLMKCQHTSSTCLFQLLFTYVLSWLLNDLHKYIYIAHTDLLNNQLLNSLWSGDRFNSSILCICAKNHISTITKSCGWSVLL